MTPETWSIDGARNVRDLGGLPTTDGGTTRHGQLVRGGIRALSADGWQALRERGIRTVVDLRNDDERPADAAPAPEDIEVVPMPLDGIEDREFWDVWQTGPQFGTPLYYGPHLERFPQRSAAVVAAIAQAPPGGVLFHCAGGRDRSGMTAMLVLALAGVTPEAIADDYARSTDADPANDELLATFLGERGTTARELIVELLEATDVEGALRAAGLTDAHVDALRARLVEHRKN